MLAIDKHSNLLRKFVNFGHKKFYKLSNVPGCFKRIQGILTEGEGSVRLTSLYFLVEISYLSCKNYIFSLLLNNLNEEVNRTEPFRLVRVPWCDIFSLKVILQV
jgi:hypothetical protein